MHRLIDSVYSFLVFYLAILPAFSSQFIKAILANVIMWNTTNLGYFDETIFDKPSHLMKCKHQTLRYENKNIWEVILFVIFLSVSLSSGEDGSAVGDAVSAWTAHLLGPSSAHSLWWVLCIHWKSYTDTFSVLQADVPGGTLRSEFISAAAILEIGWVEKRNTTTDLRLSHFLQTLS